MLINSPWLVVALIAILLAYWAWRRLPIGRVHGHTKRLHEWWSWRYSLRLERTRARIAYAKTLPQEDQMRYLARMFAKASHPLDDSWMAIERALLATGHADVLPILEDGVRNQRIGVISGIQEVVETRVADTEYRSGAYNVLAEKLRELVKTDSGDWANAERIAGALLELSPQSGAELIRECLHIESKAFSSLVELLTRRGFPITIQLVREWLKQLPSSNLDEATGKRVVALLKQLAVTQPEQAILELERLLFTEAQIEEPAANALIELKNLPHPLGSLIDLEHEQLGPEERVARLTQYFGYYRNYMFAYALLEEEGHRLEEMETALQITGAPKSANVVGKIRSILPKEGLPADAESRKGMVRNTVPDMESAVLSILEQADTSAENHLLLSMRHILAHADTIQARRPPKQARSLGGLTTGHAD